MRISVFGLGYVGSVSAACLASDGHDVVGVDTNPDKVESINRGTSPIVEPELGQRIATAVAQGRLRATLDAGEAIAASELSLVCVGTPSRQNGGLDLRYVRRVTEEIGLALASIPSRHTVVFRSTMLPGTMESELIPILERASGKRVSLDFDVAYNPEFLREGTAVADFYGPPRTVVGATEPAIGERVAALYRGIEAPLVICNLRVAETVKYADNAFHALKIAFANEVGLICKANGIDSHEVMRIFALDDKLNLSAAYLKPGFAFGGSCLPKDLRAFVHHARSRDVLPVLLEAVLDSNERHKRTALELVVRTGKRRVGVLGLSFKHQTDDLRESPAVELVEALLGKGFVVRVFDPNVALGRLVGANRAYIDAELPHLADLLVDSLERLVEASEVLVVTTPEPAFAPLADLTRPDQVVLDFAHIVELRQLGERYEGIAW